MKNVRDLLYITMMTTILVILGFIPAIPLGFIPVPIVLQNLGIMLAGVLLGWKKGCLSILLFFLLGMFIPAFSGSTFFTVFAGPTLGYIIAWLFVPMVISGILAIFKKTSFVVNLIAILLGGMIFVDVVGAVYLSVYTHTPLVASLLSNLAFIPGDTIKSVVAAMIAYKFKDKLIPSQVAC
ncbi:Biotin transporter BioY [Streptococcus pasteurianus]|uniref:biotin transporter BioY n=1 Tax=Streptococcus pasteurianus TaxID=197614 RepID=UPI0011718856|nr:biotin transporter BioY [Streptococcus pasteurianus]VUX00314.1 Biotin transporter BioY [Streptococcus pasteurianus]